MQRPLPNEYPAYAALYLDLVPQDANIFEALAEEHQRSRDFLDSLGQTRSVQPYAPGKWSPQQIVAHLCDSERIMAYRALRFARGDAQDLPSFDQELYVNNFKIGPFDRELQAWTALRQATILQFQLLNEEESMRRGSANNSEFSVRALAYMILGHEIHHLQRLRKHLV